MPVWLEQKKRPLPVAPAVPAINAAGGIQVGDLIMLSNSLGTAVGEVTNIGPTNIDFSDLDALNINQNGAATNNIRAISNGANTIAYRLFAVTYYLSVPANGELPLLLAGGLLRGQSQTFFDDETAL